MTETQAKSGTTGTSMNPVERDDQDGDEAALDHSADRSAVGRASVPVDGAAAVRVGAGVMEEDPSRTDMGTIAAGEPDPVDLTTGRSISTGTADLSTTTATASAARRPDVRSATDTRPPSVTGHGVTATGPAGPTGPVHSATATAGARSAVGRSAASAVTATPGPSTGAARVADAVRTARATVSSAASRSPRRARLFVKRIDPWSVMKFAFAVSFVLFFVFVVATSVLYLALDSMNVFTSVNKAIVEVVGGNKDVKITAGVVIGASGAIGLVMVVLLTALATLGAFIYNVCADLVGGIEVTLSEKE